MAMKSEARAEASFGVTVARTGGKPSGAYWDYRVQSVGNRRPRSEDKYSANI